MWNNLILAKRFIFRYIHSDLCFHQGVVMEWETRLSELVSIANEYLSCFLRLSFPLRFNLDVLC